MSERAVASTPVACSGARYAAVPSTEPTCVIDDSSLSAFAMPKSASLTTPSVERRRLPGFTSRCTTPLRCA